MRHHTTLPAAALFMVLLLGACGGGSGTGEAPTYTIGGTVSGLEGSGLTLQNNGGNDLTISENGPFHFSSPLTDGANYVVTVLTQPGTPAQTCSVSSGSGIVAGSAVTDVSIECGDRYESNDSCPGALLTTMSEGSSQSHLLSMTLYPPGDQDWYRVHAQADVSDPVLCWMNPKRFTFTVTMTPPAGKDYDLQVCYYPNPDQQNPCPGTAVCGESIQSGDVADSLQIIWDEVCGVSDNRYISIQVRPFQGAASDAPYSLDISFQSQ